MENITLFNTYIITVIVCVIVTIILIWLLRPGLRKLFENLVQDSEIAQFFSKLFTVILILAGLSGALNNDYKVDKANWLTLSWDSVDQLKDTLTGLLWILVVYAAFFLTLEFFNKRANK